jgi:hypothetical protein
MPRHKSLLTIIRDLVQQEVRAAIQSSEASAWSWPAAGIEEQGGIDGQGRRRLDAVGDLHPEGASPSPEGALRGARHRPHALRGGGD